MLVHVLLLKIQMQIFEKKIEQIFEDADLLLEEEFFNWAVHKTNIDAKSLHLILLLF